jgi:hypothetical protein
MRINENKVISGSVDTTTKIQPAFYILFKKGYADYTPIGSGLTKYF